MNRVPRTVLALLILIAVPMLADDDGDDRIAAQLRASVRIEQPRVIVWYHASELPASTANEFAERLSQGVDEIETVLGAKYDARYYGQAKIECFISPEAGMSHAYMGRKPYFFVTPERVDAHEVPYHHELTHIVAWWSCGKALWLQEGFADYVSSEARRRFPHEPEYDMAVFNPEDRDIDVVARRVTDGRAAAKVLPLIGVDAMPMSLGHKRAFDAIFADREITAPAFYNLSHSFTRFVVMKLGMPKVEAACRTRNPSDTIARNAGTSMEKLRAEWLESLR